MSICLFLIQHFGFLTVTMNTKGKMIAWRTLKSEMTTSIEGFIKFGSKYSLVCSPSIGMDGMTVVKMADRSIFNVLGFHFPPCFWVLDSWFGCLHVVSELTVGFWSIWRFVAREFAVKKIFEFSGKAFIFRPGPFETVFELLELSDCNGFTLTMKGREWLIAGLGTFKVVIVRIFFTMKRYIPSMETISIRKTVLKYRSTNLALFSNIVSGPQE